MNQPIRLIKSTTEELSYYVQDFFDIFGNQYVPSRDVICPHFGKLLRREIDVHDPYVDEDNVKCV